MTRWPSGATPLLAATMWLAVTPTVADAHLVTTGLGPFFDGMGHLFLTLEDLLPVVALALFAGLRGAAAGRRAMFLLPAAWLLGGVAGLATGWGPPEPLSILSFLVLGGLVAADARVPDRVVAALALLLGVAHGAMNGAALAAAELGVAGLLGVATSLFVVVTLLAALVVALRRPAARIAVRVAGSWVVATGLLLLGWQVRG